jgi:hypothetical protein
MEHPHPHADHGHAEHGDPLDAAHALAHADVWLSDVSAGYGDRVALEHWRSSAPTAPARARCSS